MYQVIQVATQLDSPDAWRSPSNNLSTWSREPTHHPQKGHKLAELPGTHGTQQKHQKVMI